MAVSRAGPIDAPRMRLYPTTMIRFHRNDLPADASFGEAVAIDTETLGLALGRDRLCLVQLSRGDGTADIVQIGAGQTRAPNLQRLLADPAIVKLFHFGRFDMGVLRHAFGTMAAPVYCTKIASKIARTYTDRHGLKDLTRELLSVEISKQQQSSDWGADTLSEAQLAYAASDVLHLHALREKLDAMLKREGRDGLARAAFAYLPDRVRLDLAGFEAMDIFSHGYP
jgi:ribonuclease D